MSIDTSRVRTDLSDFNFRDLFVEELGWSRPTERPAESFEVNGVRFERRQIAQLSGVFVFEVKAVDGHIPDVKTRKAIHAEISKLHFENLLIFLDGQSTQSLWYWVKREDGRSYPREHLYVRNQPADLFLSKLNAMVVDISEFDEEGNLPVTAVANRLREALDVERVTRKFYKEFQQQHIEFLDLITGIEDERERRWYASVLLNRLMFIYFLQRKRFINDDYDYLQNRLRESRKAGNNLYYRNFLHKLFFVGFARPAEERSAEDRRLLGKVPFLNGGLFLPHSIEQKNPHINVPDRAFENLYNLFKSYSWNLDDTPGGKADEINPDVLGYIFEKYINQKAFGAYYTRPEITQYLCEQTIYTLILDRVNSITAPPKPTPETGELFTKGHEGLFATRRYESMSDLLINLDAFLCRYLFDEVLPNLKLLDPACGSGAFLVAAMKTLINVYSAIIGRIEFLGDRHLAQKLERLRAEHPALNYFIKKRIITDNLFGVDIMKESTEIAKLRLFLALVASVQSIGQLEPLPNIDFNILAGNALIGLMHVNDKDYDELHGQGNMLRPKYRDVLNEKNRLIKQYRDFKNDIATVGLESLRDNIREKRREAKVELNDLLLREFTKLGIKFEQAGWDEKNNRAGKSQKRAVMLKDIEAMQPFHWGYEFDQIFNDGGFHGIITNPPWDIFKPNAKEFFAEHSELVTKNKMTIKEFEKEQANLLKKENVRKAWFDYLDRFPHASLYFRNSPQYKNQISVVNGRKAGTDINLYKLFVEQCFNLLREGGECGIVIPSGIYTDLGAKQLRELLFSETQITGLFCFENRKEIFEGVHRSYKFLALTFRKGGQTKDFPAAFMRLDVAELATFPKQGGVQISVELIRHLSPDSLSVMEFKSEIDVTIAEKMLRFPPLGERTEDGWNLFLGSEFHMTSDSYLFKTSPAKGRLPLYEGKMIHQFNHTLSKPRYWINKEEGRRALLGRKEEDAGQKLGYQNYRLVYRDIARNTDNRTMIAAILPRHVFAGNTLYTARPFGSANEMLFVLSMLNSFSLDFMIRQKVSAHCNMFYVYQVPVPRLTEDNPEFAPIVERAAKLICTTPEFDDLAREAGLRDHSEGVTDEAERARLRAELDGMIAHLYGLTEEEFAHVLSTFPLVSVEVKEAALEEFGKEAIKVKRDEREGEIRSLIRRGESLELEFKSSARWDIKQNKSNPAMEQIVVKTVAAFLNSEKGGTLLLGVDDDGNVLGLKPDYKMFGKQNSRDAYENFLTTLLLNNFGKDVTPLFSITFHHIEGEDVVRINVKPAPKPYFVREGNEDRLYIRAGNSTRSLTTKEAIDYCKIRFP
jgi:hypothetical protein